MESIEQKNISFQQASPAQKRVMIAEEAMKMIKGNTQVSMTHSATCDLTNNAGDFHFDESDFGQSLRHLINSQKIKCQVCGVGALFIAATMLRNEVKFNGNNLHMYCIIPMLKEFDHDELVEIELAYELGHGVFNTLDAKNQESGQEDVDFSRRYVASEERFIAICENIIANKGEFIP